MAFSITTPHLKGGVIALPPLPVTYYTPHKISALASCSVVTIYRHLADGYFPNAFVRGKRKWFIPEEDVIAYLGYDPNDFDVTVAN